MDVRCTMQLTLFATGKILSRYASIHDPTSYTGTSASRTWFVGVSQSYINDSSTVQLHDVMSNQSVAYLPMPSEWRVHVMLLRGVMLHM